MLNNTMIVSAIGLLALLVASSANGTDRDKDGVPMIDVHGHIIVVKPATVINGFHFAETRSRMVTVDNQTVSLLEFLNRFCMGKTENETCARGFKIGHIDGVSGPSERLPPGL